MSSNFLRLRLYTDLSPHLSGGKPSTGVWLLVNVQDLSTVASLWSEICAHASPQLKDQDYTGYELHSQNCLIPWNASHHILVDGQDITLVPVNEMDRTSPCQNKRRRTDDVCERCPTQAEDDLRSPNSTPFSSSPRSSEHVKNTLRKKFRHKIVPDWCLTKLPANISCNRKGCPASGIPGVSWKVTGATAGWQAQCGKKRLFFPLDKFTHSQSLAIAQQWLEEQASQPELLPTTAPASQEDEAPSASEQDDVARSCVRGVALCKGSWKARWRDSTGRQRMKTFGTKESDRLAAEEFIKNLRQSSGGQTGTEHMISRDTPPKVRLPSDFQNTQSDSAAAVLKEEDSRQVLVSLFSVSSPPNQLV